MYTRIVTWAVSNPVLTLSIAIAVLVTSFGAVAAGVVPMNFFPKLDSPAVFFKITYPDGTPASLTDEATLRAEKALMAIDAEYQKEHGKSFLIAIHRTVGAVTNVGQQGPKRATAAVTSARSVWNWWRRKIAAIRSNALIEKWRAAAGEFPGADRVNIDALSFGPGGSPIEFKLLAAGDD